MPTELKTKNITIELMGGLGNQMFQYAFYRNLQELGYNAMMDKVSWNWKTLKHGNNYQLSRLFHIEETYINEPVHYIHSEHIHHRVYRLLKRKWGFGDLKVIRDNEWIELDDNQKLMVLDNHSVYFQGYWQNEMFFKNISPILQKEFRFKLPLEDNNKELLTKIKTMPSVGIQVRRYSKENVQFNDLPLSYYHKAIQYMDAKINLLM